MDASIQKWRAEYQTVTGTIFVVGFVLYSILGVFFSYSNGSSPVMAAAIGMAGGYFFFSILSGLLWTIRFVAGKSLRTKVLLTVFFAALYLFLPNRRERFLYVLPGALAAAAAWLGFSAAFSAYVNHSNHYSALYGSLSTILLTMIWLYVCLSILFYGAYLNQLLSRVWKRREPQPPVVQPPEQDAP